MSVLGDELRVGGGNVGMVVINVPLRCVDGTCRAKLNLNAVVFGPREGKWGGSARVGEGECITCL
jgi:hypothetical protein